MIGVLRTAAGTAEDRTCNKRESEETPAAAAAAAAAGAAAAHATRSKVRGPGARP